MRTVLAKLFRSRITITLILLFAMLSLGGAAYSFKANFDPGPVSAAQPRGEPLKGFESHAAFEKECTHCHAPVRCLAANLCQDCHFEIAKQRAEASGLHGLLPGTDKCQNCHGEHRGRDAVISDVAFANIDHERLTGFSLARHETDYDGANLSCQACHTEGRFAPESVDCATCHNADNANYMGEHTQRFGGNCLGCHDGRDRMVNLDHAQVFALEGGHEDAACEDCHADQVFAETVRRCVECHEDPEVHLGEFGLDCARCHVAAAWTPAELRQHTFLLDHGDNPREACETCHEGTYVEYTCYGCHDHEPEQMKVAHVKEGIGEFDACAECHPTGREGEAANRDGSQPGQPAGDEGGASGQ
jgi:hypothetical protein